MSINISMSAACYKDTLEAAIVDANSFPDTPLNRGIQTNLSKFVDDSAITLTEQESEQLFWGFYSETDN